MAAVMLFLQQTTGKTKRHTHFCMPLEPVFTRDCGGRVHFTDEPTGALDSKNANTLMTKLAGMNEDEDTTILMVTHDCSAASFCKRILFIRDGELFHELRRDVPGESRTSFYERIVNVVACMGGGSANVI